MRSDRILLGYVKMPAVTGFSLTIATGGSNHGWRSYSTSYGSISPTPVYKRGIQVVAMFSEAVSDMCLELGSTSGLPPSVVAIGRDFFNKIVFQDGAGDPVTLNAADATYDQSFLSPMFFCRWRWGNGSSPYWAVGDVGEVKTVQIL